VSDVHEHPGMNFEEALVHSSNIAMALIGLQLGRARIVEVFDSFGLCRPTGIRLPAEARGKYTDKSEWRPLYSTVSVSFGYELMVSPIQLATAFAAVVNGGYLLEPRIVDRMVRDGVVETLPSRKVIGRPISEATSRRMREILKRVVEEGTARYLAVKGFEFGGKTGTADMARGGYTKKDYLASFEAFAPYDNPRVVALCMLEKPREGSYYGGVAAGPIVVEVFRRLFHVDEEMELTRLNRLAGRE
jgi:cell division protein FtsI (penicillin-binding protein 3)